MMREGEGYWEGAFPEPKKAKSEKMKVESERAKARQKKRKKKKERESSRNKTKTKKKNINSPSHLFHPSQTPFHHPYQAYSPANYAQKGSHRSTSGSSPTLPKTTRRRRQQQQQQDHLSTK